MINLRCYNEVQETYSNLSQKTRSWILSNIAKGQNSQEYMPSTLLGKEWQYANEREHVYTF